MAGMSVLALAHRLLTARLAVFAAFGLLVLTACSPPALSDHLEIGTQDGIHRQFTVEVARKPSERERGLMYRQSLAADAGMLFDFESDQVVEMWMKNTYIPLDMLFISRDGIVTRVAADAVPQSLAIIASGEPIRAVLEIKGGEAARQGITPGAKVVHPLFQSAR
jgi:uncharacterized membrane protein (UPF0127 family)